MGKYSTAYPFSNGYEFQAETPIGLVDIVHWGDTIVVFAGDTWKQRTENIIINRIPVSFRASLVKYQKGQYNPNDKEWKVEHLSASRRDKFLEDATDAQRRKINDALIEWVDRFSATQYGKEAYLRGLEAHHDSYLHRIAGQLDDIEEEQLELLADLDRHKNLRNQAHEALRQLNFPTEEVLAGDPGEPND